MLKLINVKKDYLAGENTVHALKGVNLEFRKSEFVSILGPSGCGKTTMLNIIGGLDHYTFGDLVINGISTKEFKDRDWDTYRNHSIGFVFQSYNLIPHQSVLQNVELALALSGVSKKERRLKAKKALESVGLGNQFHKRPSEMSGGQMQRVAIARALVNDPDIILADEPTGALDTETSIQVLDILKKVSKDRLVIMVTHNPELAEKYSTRIVKMLDGLIVSDSAPLTEEEKECYNKKQTEEIKEKQSKKTKKVKKPSMSLWTSFSLSLKNLFTKKGRTILTSFAGSIGIIGIALIYAVSQGATNYINFVQEATLSSYPLTIQSEHTDMGSMLQAFMDSAKSSGEHKDDAVYEKTALYDLVNAINSTETKQNDLKSFMAYIEEQKSNNDSKLHSALSGVQYTYDFDLLVYTKSVDSRIIQSDTKALMMEMIAKYLGTGALDSNFSGNSSNGTMMTMASSSMGLWQEMLSGLDGEYVSPLIKSQYNLLTENSRWPTAYNEVVLVVDENNEIDDMTLFALGLKSQAEMDEIIDAADSGEKIEKQPSKWSFEEILDMDFRVILNSDCYIFNSETKTYDDLRSTDIGMEWLYENKGIDIKVVGIVKPSEDSMSNALTGTICYTNLLTTHIAEESKKSEALIAQLKEENRYIDIFTGLPFSEGAEAMTTAEKAQKFTDYINQATNISKKEAYIRIKGIPTQQFLDVAVTQANTNFADRTAKVGFLLNTLVGSMGADETTVLSYLNKKTDDEINAIFNQIIIEGATAQFKNSVRAEIEPLDDNLVASMLDNEMKTYSEDQKASYYLVALDFSESSYKDNLRILGNINLDEPSTINLFASTFENKDIIEEVIKDYNILVEESKKITYTDYVGLLMSSITTIINAITYVLIGFVAISLIVSSIMIGVITLISVQERTKEIGVLRALGASKQNVSSMFNAETVLIGFFSGLVGIGATCLLCLPINLILKLLTGLNNLRAVLPIEVALLLILISVVLTLIAGIIPSRSAAKKDPVVALRTE